MAYHDATSVVSSTASQATIGRGDAAAIPIRPLGDSPNGTTISWVDGNDDCVLPHFPQRLSHRDFLPLAYPLMLLSRQIEERLLELFQKGYVKGTVTSSAGNEATVIGMTMPLRPGRDVVSLLHRDLGGHLALGMSPYELFCQYMANAASPTHGREGNVHHGDAAKRRMPMISHLGRMLSVTVGSVWAARRAGENVFGLAAIGDGGSSTGEFHEAINLASVQRTPVLFLVENNHYSFSTPTDRQYHCHRLSDRAAGYGIAGKTVNGLDPWEVYSAVCDALEAMQADPMPSILECMSIRLRGHAAYDKGDYVPADMKQRWLALDPLPATRQQLLDVCGFAEERVAEIDRVVAEEVRSAVAKAMAVGRPDPTTARVPVFAEQKPEKVKPYRAAKVKNGEAVHHALDYLLTENPSAFLMGLDIGTYGSAFKTCKGLLAKHGENRVIDMPICEAAQTGFALGASQTGGRPILEYQFADFSTEAATQLGLNLGSWYFRAGQPAPVLVRLPCGGGLTLGAFHSGEFEGIWSRFSGLKLLYPATAQETFEALLAGFYDPNPCLVFEHKLLYWSKSGDIDFDGDLAAIWRPRRYVEGDELTVVAFGAMVHEALAAAQRRPRGMEIWNPFALQPMDLSPIVESVRRTGRLLVVQECGAMQGLGDHVISVVCQEVGGKLKCRPKLIAAPDAPVPFAPELEFQTRPNSQRIESVADQMIRES